MNWETPLKLGSAAGGGVVGYLFGGWYFLLSALLALVVIDYATGMLAAGKEGNLNSKVGTRGIPKKITMLLLVAVAHLIDGVLGTGNSMRDAAAYFYIANELLSIIENAGRLGAPVPDVLVRAVQVLKQKNSEK
ncbi:phage holin family protein [Tumebacillus permanentifrigoris]|uniref:Toxin secretion/phage lysis holin n=1 Tax=Tumebacillus permanentifrigoris TaxID=378543 RepID=A0A316DFP6_9BACL|nr:toxin secretion/phage lysis holin [Tumebacillus permanentifrigoris]